MTAGQGHFLRANPNIACLLLCSSARLLGMFLGTKDLTRMCNLSPWSCSTEGPTCLRKHFHGWCQSPFANPKVSSLVVLNTRDEYKWSHINGESPRFSKSWPDLFLEHWRESKPMLEGPWLVVSLLGSWNLILSTPQGKPPSRSCPLPGLFSDTFCPQKPLPPTLSLNQRKIRVYSQAISGGCLVYQMSLRVWWHILWRLGGKHLRLWATFYHQMRNRADSLTKDSTGPARQRPGRCQTNSWYPVSPLVTPESTLPPWTRNQTQSISAPAENLLKPHLLLFG